MLSFKVNDTDAKVNVNFDATAVIVIVVKQQQQQQQRHNFILLSLHGIALSIIKLFSYASTIFLFY